MNNKKKKKTWFLFSFTSHHKHQSLNMFFENGEQARKILDPTKDQVIANECFIDRYFYFLAFKWCSIP